MERSIGTIQNYYGGLILKEEDGKFWWAIPNWDGKFWEEIPNYLFEALNRFQDESDAREKADV